MSRCSCRAPEVVSGTSKGAYDGRQRPVKGSRPALFGCCKQREHVKVHCRAAAELLRCSSEPPRGTVKDVSGQWKEAGLCCVVVYLCHQTQFFGAASFESGDSLYSS